MRLGRWIALVGLIVAGVVALPATRAAAATPITCTSGNTPTGDVRGDLVVPAGGACALHDVDVHGRVTVAADGFLLLSDGAHIGGDLTLGVHSFFELNGSSVQGNVSLDYVAVLDLDHGSSVGGSIRGTFDQTSETEECDFIVFDSTVHGDLAVDMNGLFREACVQASVIGGDLNIAHAALGISRSTIGHNVVLTAPRSYRQLKFGNGWGPSSLCAVTVHGKLTLEDSVSHVALGDDYCGSGRLDVYGSLVIIDNQGSVSVAAHVYGNVVCRRNTHHPIASHPTSRHLQMIVDGHLLGQCSTLAVRPA